MAGGGTGGGPRFMLGVVPVDECVVKLVLFTLLVSLSIVVFLRPVGFNFGIPLENNPPNPIGPLVLTPPLKVFDPLLSLVPEEEEFDSPLTLPVTTGALLSTVTVFFKAFPALIDCSRRLLS